MSLQAMNWVLYEIDPAELEQSEFRIMLVIADHADTEGAGVWLGAGKIAALSRLSVRQVRYALRHLQDKGLIRRGDQRLVKHLPANKRPVVYDLVMDDDRGATIAPQEPETRGATIAPQKEQECNLTAPQKEPLGCNRGATGVQSGVQHDCIQTQYKEEPIKPREYARENETKTTDERRQALADWTPNENHIGTASRYGLDLTAETRKFRASMLSNGRIPADMDSAFDLWLERGRELGLGGTGAKTGKPHRHTWKCDHVTGILARFGMTPEDGYELAQGIAAKLRDGMDEQAITAELAEVQQQESYWEAA